MTLPGWLHPLRCRRWLGPLLVGLLLSACVYAVVERNAPELKKRYLLTEDLVLTDMQMPVPGLVPGQRLVPSAVPRAQFDYFREMYGNLRPEGELTDRGLIRRGSEVRVQVVFIARNPDGEGRAAEFKFTDPETGEQTTAYVSWDEVAPVLQEVK